MPMVAPGTAVESMGRRPFDPSEEDDLEAEGMTWEAMAASGNRDAVRGRPSST